MPNPVWAQREYFLRAKHSNVFKRVDNIYTGTTLASTWTPATGKKFVLKGGCVQVNVVVVLQAAVPGAIACFMDGAATAPIVPLGHITLAAQPVGPLQLSAWGTAATQVYTPPFVQFDLGEGWTSAAANNVLKFGLVLSTTDGTSAASTTGSSGKIWVNGIIWGEEV